MKLKIVVIEIVVIFLIGIIPSLISYYFGGVTGFEKLTKELLPSKLVMNYALLIGLAYFIVAFLDYWFLKTSQLSNTLFWYIRTILSQIGTSVLSILRIGTGIFLSLLGLWLYHDLDTIQLNDVLFLLGYSALMFAECVIIAFAHEFVKKWERAKI